MPPTKKFIPFLLAVVLLSACGPSGDEINIRLTPQERERFQAIASDRLDSLRPVLDSLCEARFEDRVAVLTDSIVQRRLEEEARLRRRVRR